MFIDAQVCSRVRAEPFCYNYMVCTRPIEFTCRDYARHSVRVRCCEKYMTNLLSKKHSLFLIYFSFIEDFPFLLKYTFACGAATRIFGICNDKRATLLCRFFFFSAEAEHLLLFAAVPVNCNSLAF